MATLALVGLAIDPVRWTAVGVGTGGMPESLGRALVDRVRACGGDFGLLAHELIEQAPTGWRSLESYPGDRHRADEGFASFQAEADGACALRLRAEGGRLGRFAFEWFYLFDVAGRRLRISRCRPRVPAGPTDWLAIELLPFETIRFDATGAPESPPRLRRIKGHWKRAIPSGEPRAPDPERRARFSQLYSENGVERASIGTATKRALRDLIERAAGQRIAPGSCVRVAFDDGATDIRAVDLGEGAQLVYAIDTIRPPEHALYGIIEFPLDLSALFVPLIGEVGDAIRSIVIELAGPASCQPPFRDLATPPCVAVAEVDGDEVRVARFWLVTAAGDGPGEIALEVARTVDPGGEIGDELGPVDALSNDFPFECLRWLADLTTTQTHEVSTKPG